MTGKNDLIVRKDNALIRAAYTLSLAEHRLILLAVADANGQADVLKDMTVYAEDYADRFKVTRQAAYMALHDAAKQLLSAALPSSVFPPRERGGRWSAAGYSASNTGKPKPW